MSSNDSNNHYRGFKAFRVLFLLCRRFPEDYFSTLNSCISYNNQVSTDVFGVERPGRWDLNASRAF